MMDTLLLTIYFIVVFYVLYKMALGLEDKLEDKVVILLDEKTLNQQTNDQLSLQKTARRFSARIHQVALGKEKKIKHTALQLVVDPDKVMPIGPEALLIQETMKMSDEALQEYLHEKITIRVSPINKQKLKPVVYLGVTVDNDTANTLVTINWDRSSIEMFGQGNRTVRSTANMPIDLSQPQVLTVVNPGMVVSSNVTTERKYNRDPETNRVGMPEPLVDLKQRVEMSKMPNITGDKPNIQPLYTLDLMLGLKRRTENDTALVNVLVPFIFKMKIEVDQPAFPPIRWMLKNFGSQSKMQNGWIWGGGRK